MMGVKDVTLSNINPTSNGGYILFGEYFTKWSKVYVNGEKQKTTFVNNNRIDINELELKQGDVITVSQVGSSNTIFRTTDKYVYENSVLNRQKGTGTDTSISWIGQGAEE